MAETINFELVSPERLLLSEPVEMVVVPGAEGDFGVLARHSPLISTVRPGVIAIYEGGKIVRRIFVAGGFAEVTPERCTVLADEALALDGIDRAQAEARLGLARDALTDAASEENTAAAIQRIAVAEALVAAVGQAGTH